MAPIFRKVVIVATAEGLLLSPPTPRAQKSSQSIRIPYGKSEADLIATSRSGDGRDEISFEAYGIVGIVFIPGHPPRWLNSVGILSVTSCAYLVSITNRKQVAQINGKSVYVVTGVTLIPLSSFAEAKQATEQARSTLRPEVVAFSDSSPDSDSSYEEEGHKHDLDMGEIDDDVNMHTPLQDRKDPLDDLLKDEPSIARDVIGRKGQYGRFAERWFSRSGWNVERKRLLGMSAGSSSADVDSSSNSESNLPVLGGIAEHQEGRRRIASTGNSPNVALTLLPKLLRTTKMLLNSQSFYFSYDVDLTRRSGTQEPQLFSELPLHKVVDPLYFWNRHLLSRLIDAGHHSFILPLVQGFVGQRAFSVDTRRSEGVIANVKHDVGEVIELQENASSSQGFKASSRTKDFLITLISRRSVTRPGLRYLRRGVDEEGSVANLVETEQILSDPSWTPSSRVFSFVQIRGSIPLFFSQSPYSFKPTPILQHSFEANHTAFKKHFADISRRYGDVQIALLVDKQGPEAKIGEEYEKHVNNLNKSGGINGVKIDFEWFDFHHICRGMKFENVSILMNSLDGSLNSFGVFEGLNGKVVHLQTGVLRTNCMDCLDRTNVVQTACGQRALEQQLSAEGITMNLQNDESTQWFNFLWADNGDSISKQYASTAALKGDYTRTRKRDYRGAINDFGLSLSRYFNNVVNDWFSQAAIDFLLGNVTDEVFEEFEANMMSGDPRTSMSKVRQNAVDISFKIVVEDQTEELYGGWAILTSQEPNSLRRLPLEEIVLLITDAALYAVHFDWNMEKVSAFERVGLSNIVGLYRGAYITSTFTALQTDPKRNQGFVVQYRPGGESVARVNTRSLSTAAATPKKEAFSGQAKEVSEALKAEELAQRVAESSIGGKSEDRKAEETGSIRFRAFKALPARSCFSTKRSAVGEGVTVTEQSLVKDICEEIARLVGKDPREWIREKDVISLAEARKNTGILEQWGHSLKRFLWA